MAADANKGIEEDLVKIQELSYKSSAGSFVPCMWDVGAGTMGPGGRNGAYARQCKKYALIDSDKQLCAIHARKFYIGDARSKQSQVLLRKGTGLRRTAARRGVFRPADALATAEYFKSFNPAKDSCTYVAAAADAVNGVYDLEQAMCIVKKKTAKTPTA